MLLLFLVSVGGGAAALPARGGVRHELRSAVKLVVAHPAREAEAMFQHVAPLQRVALEAHAAQPAVNGALGAGRSFGLGPVEGQVLRLSLIHISEPTRR